jgi:hypothetical protein
MMLASLLLATAPTIMSLHPSPGTAIARVGSRVIAYSEIAESPRDLPREQERLSEVLWRELADAYIQANHVRITDDDIAAATPAQLRSPGIAHRVASVQRAVVDAVRRVHAGESIESAYRDELSREALSKRGIEDVSVPLSTLRSALLTLNDEAAVRNYLEKGSEEALSRTYHDHAYRLARWKKIEEIVRSKTHGTAPTKREIWGELIRATPVEILHAEYHLPFEKEKSQ